MTALIGWGGTVNFTDDWVYDQAVNTYALDKEMAENEELNRGFDRVYEEIDHLEDKIDLLQSEFQKFRNEINQKLDTILKHITGMN